MMNSYKLVPGHYSAPGNYIYFFVAMTTGYCILGFSVEVITYSLEVCKSFKEIYITFRLSPGCILGQN